MQTINCFLHTDISTSSEEPLCYADLAVLKTSCEHVAYFTNFLPRITDLKRQASLYWVMSNRHFAKGTDAIHIVDVAQLTI